MQAAPPHAAAHMDSVYRYQRFIYDATRRYYLFGRDRLLADLKVPDGGSALEIGCGTARNLIRAGRLYPTARLYGIDISQQMLRTARGKIDRTGLKGRITLAAADATAFSPEALFGRAAFDRVFISYALSMIPPWRETVEQAAACVAPGGQLQVVDFGDFAAFPEWLRTAQLNWLRRFSVTPIPRLDEELADIAKRLGFTATSVRLYGGYAIKATLARRSRLTPFADG
jgi:S-adenosylmethionine-diacylgycerolhomoserine-N-methlytransferase